MANARSKNSKMRKKDNETGLGGFTIIEVVLVLAIAGLIFLMVFIALPALQRAQRDTQRRDDMARLGTALTNYQTNNNGRLPNDTGDSLIHCSPTKSTVKELKDKGSSCDFVLKYLNSSTATDDSESEFVDPTGDPYKLTFGQYKKANTFNPSNLKYDEKTVWLLYGARCDGENVKETGSKRDYVIVYKLEGAGTYCSDNGS